MDQARFNNQLGGPHLAVHQLKASHLEQQFSNHNSISSFLATKPKTHFPQQPPYTLAPPLVSGSTQDWGDLISQVMEGMGGTIMPPNSGSGNGMTAMTPVPSSGTTNWEDAMNELIGQWSSQMSTSAPPGGSMNVQQCVDSILSIINTIQGQLPGMGATQTPSTNG